MKKLKPGEIVSGTAKVDAGYHPGIGSEVKAGEVYSVHAEHFPLEILERPEDVLFPFEPDPDEEQAKAEAAAQESPKDTKKGGK